MKFKKTNWMLMAVIFLGLSIAVSSCKDDDNDTSSTIRVDEELIEKGLEVDANIQTVELAVEMDGMWTPLIDEGDNSWVYIENNHYMFEGPKKLKLAFTRNPEGTDRQAKLQLFTTETVDPVTINIRQKGHDENASAVTSGVVFQTQGLGHGVVINYFLDTAQVSKNIKNKPETFSILKASGNNSVYDMEKIQSLVNNGILKKAAYEETSNNVYELAASLVDSTVVQHKDFSASVNMSASFGFLEFEAAFTYKASKSQSSGHVDYTILRYAPLYEVGVSPAEIAAYAIDQSIEPMINYDDEYNKVTEAVEKKYGGWEQLKKKSAIVYNGWMKKLNKFRPDFGGVFSTGFGADLWEYYRAMMEENEEKAKAALESIDENYSPFVITGGTWGGSMNVLCRVDTMRMEGEDELEASLKADLNNIGSVGGEVHLSSDGLDLFRNSDVRISIYGGDPSIGDGITKWLLSPQVTDYTQMQTLLRKWIKTMKSPADPESDTKSSAAPIEYIFTPVWMLFDQEYRQFARDWFFERYKGSSVMDFFGYCENPRDKWPSEPSQLLGDKKEKTDTKEEETK